MRFMDEPNVVGKAVYPLPVDRSIGLEGRPDLIYLFLGSDRPAVDVLVAKQTRFHGRYCGCRTLGHITMAELALDIVLRHVDRMRKCDRLVRSVA